VVDRALEILVGAGADSPDAVAAARRLHPTLDHVVPALLGTTMAPTLLEGSAARNVMPARASVELDCRILPGTTEADVERAVRARLGTDVPYDLSFPEALVPGSESPPSGPLYEACQSFLDETDPGALLLPVLCTGFTDSAFLRRAYGTTAYGISPFRRTPAEVVEAGYHNRDERVHVDDLLLSVRFHLHVVHRLLGS
jgi:acetylornithine deacetylase/succinyl-diaminopimelate desuccinylase-like protein